MIVADCSFASKHSSPKPTIFVCNHQNLQVPLILIANMDVSLGLEGTHVFITGAGGHSGRPVVAAFLAAGAKVTAADIDQEKLALLCNGLGNITIRTVILDISNGDAMRKAFISAADSPYGPPLCCIALAGLDLSVLSQAESICDGRLVQWQAVWKVNVEGTFLTAQMWLRTVREAAFKEEVKSG
jgi:NAD(P)-dependent dehydrogenase (short-subunit alcohol dehydrogenase family)